MNNYQIPIYPSNTTPLATNPTVTQADATRANIALCFSGGGSRALSCALGQMLGLSKLTAANGQTLLERARYISSVSGGTWASLLYCFRPESISDAEFLGSYAPPTQLFYNQNSPDGVNLSLMGSHALGRVPQNFANLKTLTLRDNIVFDFLALTLLKDIPLKTSAQWLWMYVVGKNVLADFELYTYQNSLFKPSETPWNYAGAQFFSLSEGYAQAHIFNKPSSPSAEQFVYARRNVPMLIMNTNIIGQRPATANLSGPLQVPLQVSPVAASIYGKNPLATDPLGGGGVESFGFSSLLTATQDVAADAATNRVGANFSRVYSLADIAACSSAFYAAALADPLAAVLAELQNLDDAPLKNHFDKFAHLGEEILIQELRKKIAEASDKLHGLEDLVPRYNYWSPSAVSEGPSANHTLAFSDGGDLENTGVAGLLAQLQNNIGYLVSFVNGAEVLEKKNGEIIAATQIAPLFGMAYSDKLGQFKAYQAEGKNPFTGLTDPCGFLQVFVNSHNALGISQFDALRTGLYQANGSDNKTSPAFFRQSLTLVDNSLLGIKLQASGANNSVELLWVQNARVNEWQDALTDPLLKQKISAGQAAGGATEFADFPYYSTGEKIHATAAETNALAQMWGWCICDERSPLRVAIADFFAQAEAAQ
jgi:hypothetical protein